MNTLCEMPINHPIPHAQLPSTLHFKLKTLSISNKPQPRSIPPTDDFNITKYKQ